MPDGFCHLKPDRLFDGVCPGGPGPLHHHCSVERSSTVTQHTDEVCHLTDPMESETRFEADPNVRQLTRGCVTTSESAGCGGDALPPLQMAVDAVSA